MPVAHAGDARLVDYLDDKIQTLADLESLDSLLINVRNQQSLLKQQLQDAQTTLQNAKNTSVEHASNLKARVKEFNREQQEIDKKLMIVTQSDTSQDAVAKFDVSMDKLNKLTVAKEYLRLLQDVDTLGVECLEQLGTSDAAALNAYQRLTKLLQALQPLQAAADGAAPHLLHHIHSKANNLKSQMEKVFSAQLEAVLKKNSWPNLDTALSEPLQEDMSNAISKLLELQQTELEAHEKLNHGSRQIQPLVLLPLKVLLRSLELGFRYHFEGDRPTNRLERPEFFLSHVTERILARYIDFIETYLQPVLLQKFRGTDIALNYAYIDASSAFITSLLPMLRKKIFSILPQILKQPPLLSHLIHEVMKFDTELREEWQYDGGTRGQVWNGLAHEVLSHDDVFNHWLKAEKDFALSRYLEIVDEPGSFDLDFDSVGSGKTKPSKAAIRVNDLLEATTDNYRGLVSFSQKLRFLIDIQISIFDLFHGRLSDALGTYLARTSTLGRASREDQAMLQGVAGLERLCRIFGSADYLERAMRDWNDDVFFLELWSELQHRATHNSSQAVIAGSLTVAQVAVRTSSTITSSDAATPASEFEEGALFDETAAAYTHLRQRVEGVMADLLVNNARSALAAYTRINPWASLAPTGQPDAQLPTTAELDGLLQGLRVLLAYLARAVGTVSLRRLSKGLLATIDGILLEQVILAHSFSSAGAAQLSADVAAVSSIVAKYLDRSAVSSGLARLRQATRLLGIAVKRRRDDGEEGGGGGEEIGLFEAGKMLYEGSGEEAGGMLEEMGLDRLSVAEARKVLARRVELGS